MFDDLPTPAIAISGPIVRRNIERLADYARQHHLNVRPHTKTHKSLPVARLQLEQGAIGLTVAKVGEAKVMSAATDDLLMAYPAVDPARCRELAELAKHKTLRVGLDSAYAASALQEAAREAGSTIGVLVDVDSGNHRTGVQSPAEALALAQHVARQRNLRLDGIMFYPGHLRSAIDKPAMAKIDALLDQVIELWRRSGLEARIVSGGSTPTAPATHLIRQTTEIRPGTYVYNDMNSVHAGCATLDDVAARIVCTVVSTAVPGQIVLDAGSKTLTSDRCTPAPDSGHGLVVEYPQARITKLSEEHAQVDVTACNGSVPKVGDRVTVIPNHICPCINLQDQFWWYDAGFEQSDDPIPMPVDARGKVF